MSALMTPQSMLELPIARLAAFPSHELQQLKVNAADLLALAKRLAEHVDAALHAKYAQRAKSLRDAEGKDSGVVHFDDGAVHISAELPKRVDWDQKKLAQLAQRIADAGEDPAEYIDVTYKVAETKFNAWPQALREQFAVARTLKLGKPVYKLSQPAGAGEGGAQ